MWTNYCHCVLICHFWGILGYLQNTRVHEVSFTTLGETHHSPFGKVSTFAKQKQKISLSFSGTLWSGITYNLRQFCNSIPNLKRFEVWSIQLSGLRSDPPHVIKKMIFWLSKKVMPQEVDLGQFQFIVETLFVWLPDTLDHLMAILNMDPST